MNTKNNATFHFGNVEAKNNFLANLPKYITVIEDLGKCDIILNIGGLAQFLKIRSYINAEIFFN